MDKASLDLLATLVRRRELRDGNKSATRPDEAALSSLDSSMKRNNALLRRIRTLSDESRAAVLEEIGTTNQSRFVAEAAAALVEGLQRPREVAAAAEVAAALHRRYADLAAGLEQALARELPSPSAPTTEDRPALVRRRALLRLAVELVATETVPAALTLIGGEVRRLCAAASESGNVAALSLLASLAKAGREELLGLGIGDSSAGDSDAAAARLREEIGLAWHAPAGARQQLFAALRAALEAAATRLARERARLERVETRNARNLVWRGDLSEAAVSSQQEQSEACEALSAACVGLAEALELDPAELVLPPEAPEEPADAGGADAASPASTSPFEDDESRALYEDLLDLYALVPGVLLGGRSAPDAEAMAAAVQEAAEAAEARAGDASRPEPRPDAGPAAAKGAAATGAVAAPPSTNDTSGSLRELLERLSSCVSREDADAIALQFCHIASKAARRRLAQELCEVPSGAFALLPFLARIAATLGRVWADVPATLVAHLQAEAARQRRHKDVSASGRATEARVRNARYTAELLKFGVFPPGPAFTTLRALLDDFAGTSVDAACALVEGAGRYLARRADTRERLEAMLAVMEKLAAVRRLDARQSALVAAAASAVRTAPAAAGARRKRRPPLQAYARHVVHAAVALPAVAPAQPARAARRGKARPAPTPAERALAALRRMPWEPADEAYLRGLLVRAATKAPAASLGTLASLCAGLARFHPALGVGVVDDLIEAVWQGLEARPPHAPSLQQQLATVRMLAECYNFRLADSRAIFAVVDALVAAGDGSSADGPRREGGFFRIRLACALLGTCGAYFTGAGSRPRLDLALARLQALVLAQATALPLEIELDLEDLEAELGVPRPAFQTLEAAQEAIEELERRQAAAQPVAAGGDEGADLDLEEEGVAEDQVSDGDSGSDSGSDSDSESKSGSSDEASSDAASNSDDGDDAEAAGESDEEMGDAGSPAEQSPEDEQFERDLESMLAGTKKSYLLSSSSSGAGRRSHLFAPPERSAAVGPRAGAGAPIAFDVMLRRGPKTEPVKLLRQLAIPVAPRYEDRLRARQAAERAEREEIKRFVLAADRRSAEELDADEASARQARRRGQDGRRRVGFVQGSSIMGGG